jgi:hypothetical protein
VLEKTLQRIHQLCDTLPVNAHHVEPYRELMSITTLSGLVAVALYLISLMFQGQAVKARTARTKTRGIVLFAGLVLSLWPGVNGG